MASVARVTEISVQSPDGFEDAIAQGVARATQTLRHVRSAYVKEMRVAVEDDRIAGYQVNLQVTFELEG